MLNDLFYKAVDILAWFGLTTTCYALTFWMWYK